MAPNMCFGNHTPVLKLLFPIKARMEVSWNNGNGHRSHHFKMTLTRAQLCLTCLAALCFGVAYHCYGQLIPFYTDADYQRNEPANPSWFVSNNCEPSMLYLDGIYQSSGLALANDMSMATVWLIQTNWHKGGHH